MVKGSKGMEKVGMKLWMLRSRSTDVNCDHSASMQNCSKITGLFLRVRSG
jgi:hypothetical protein